MRKTIGLALVAALALGALAAPQAAGKRKKKTVTVKKKFSAGPHAPAPILTDIDSGGCLNTVEGVTKTTVEYHTPKKGTFTAKIFNFSGDWDLFVTDKNDTVLGSATSDQTVSGAPPTEKVVVKVPAKYHVKVVACNWLGQSLTADGQYIFKYKK